MSDQTASEYMRRFAEKRSHELVGALLKNLGSSALFWPKTARADGLIALFRPLPNNRAGAAEEIRACIRAQDPFCFLALLVEGRLVDLWYESPREAFRWTYRLRTVEGEESLSMPERSPISPEARLLAASPAN